MSADWTNLSVIIPAVLGGVVSSVVIGFIVKAGKTSETVLTGTIRVESLEGNVKDIKKTVSEGFDKIEGVINRKDEERRGDMHRLWNRIEQMNTEIILHKYRLDQVDQKMQKNGAAPIR